VGLALLADQGAALSVMKFLFSNIILISFYIIIYIGKQHKKSAIYQISKKRKPQPSLKNALY
jgi:hypothetical protein